MISVTGIAVSSMAMVIVLSGFNGIEKIVADMYNSFDADLKVSLNEGKTFQTKKIDLDKIKQLNGVNFASLVIEETIILQNEDKFETCKLKGVELPYFDSTHLDTLMVEGLPDLEYEGIDYCIPGAVLQSRLGFTSDPRFQNELTINGMLRDKKISMTSQPFNQQKIQVGGVFMTGIYANDAKYIFVSIGFAEKLLEFNKEATGVDIFTDNLSEREFSNLKLKVSEIIGQDFKVETREEQHALIFSATKSEKIAVFIILCFVLVIAAFSMIASLTMLILEKRKDVFTLYSVGFTKREVRRDRKSVV